MSNTVIQIKRSAVTSTPPNGSLSAGELAISYASDKLFSGNSAGTGVDEIGGKFYVDMTQFAYAQANAAFDAANSAGSSATVSAAFGTANLAYAHANAAFDTANTVSTDLTAANTFLQGYADTAESDAISSAASYTDSANTFLRGYADTAESDAISSAASYTDAANTFLQGYADTAATNAGTGANSYADLTFLPLSGGTISGDLVITQNLTISGVVTYANTQTLLIGDNILSLNADLPEGVAPSEDAGIEVNRGSSSNVFLQWTENVDKWQFTNNGSTFYDIATNTSVELVQTNVEGANTFLQGYADTAESDAISTAATYTDGANTFLQGYADTAESDAISTAATYTDGANTFLQGYADTAESDAISTAATYTDGANTYLQATFSNAANLTSGTLASARLSGSYTGITGVGTLTAGTWNGSTIGVPYGGTGGTTFTTNGILYGQGASALAVTSAGSEGQVLQADASGVPQFGDLDGGTF